MSTAKSNKFHKGQLVRSGSLDIPEILLNDIKKNGWAFRWLNADRLFKSGGYDERGFIAYRIPDNLRKPLQPGEYAEDYQMSIDGFYRRGDLILGIMPQVKVDARRAFIKQQTQEELDIRKRIKGTYHGVSVEDVDQKVGSLQPTVNEILEK